LTRVGSSSIPDPPDELVRAIAEGKAILFAGAGVSMSELPDFNGLLRTLLAHAQQQDSISASEFNELEQAIGQRELLFVAETIRKELGEGAFLQKLQSMFRGASPTQRHKLIAHAIQSPDYLDTRIEEMRSEGVAPTQIFDLLYRSGYQPSRMPLMLELLKSAAVPPAYLNKLAPELAEAVADKLSGSDMIIPYVSNYVSQVPDATTVFQEIALKLLLTPQGEHNPQVYPIDEWVELAHKFVEQSPVLVAQAALKRISDFELFHATEYIDRVLEPAWKAGNKQQLFTEVFAPYLTARDSKGWHLRQELEAFPWEELGAEFLVEWVSADPKNRAHHLAEVLGPPVGRPSDLHAILLERFDAQGVGSAYTAKFMSGAFFGSASDWTRGKLEQAKQWLVDDRPVIVEWAKRLVRSLEKDLQREVDREAEEPLLY
jgi:hypothetical protein